MRSEIFWQKGAGAGVQWLGVVGCPPLILYLKTPTNIFWCFQKEITREVVEIKKVPLAKNNLWNGQNRYGL